MQTAENGTLFAQQHITAESFRQYLLQHGWQAIPRSHIDGPARIFRHSDYVGEIGFIMPYEKDFCVDCNRLRISARGNLHLCLFGDESIPLRDLLA